MQVVHSHQVGSEGVYDSAEGEPIPPRGGHVGNLNPLVTRYRLLAPGNEVLPWGGSSALAAQKLLKKKCCQKGQQKSHYTFIYTYIPFY